MSIKKIVVRVEVIIAVFLLLANSCLWIIAKIVWRSAEDTLIKTGRLVPKITVLLLTLA